MEITLLHGIAKGMRATIVNDFGLTKYGNLYLIKYISGKWAGQTDTALDSDFSYAA